MTKRNGAPAISREDIEAFRAESTSNHRWWEQYLVRYLVPALAGIGILVFLYQRADTSTLHRSIDALLKISPEWELAIWFGLGSLYAYIASLPVLVWHATRSLAQRPDLHNKTLGVAFALLLMTGALCATPAFTTTGAGLAPTLAVLITFGFAGLQIWRLCLTYFCIRQPYFGSVNAYQYLLKVTRARQLPANKEFVDTYRHQREHGNVPVILLTQLFLAMLLYVIHSDKEPTGREHALALLILTLWCAPGVLVYAASQSLEFRLSGAQRHKPRKKTAAKATTPDASAAGASPTSPVANDADQWLDKPIPWKAIWVAMPIIPAALLWFQLDQLHAQHVWLPSVASASALVPLLTLSLLLGAAWLLVFLCPSLFIGYLSTTQLTSKARWRFFCWLIAGIIAVAVGGSILSTLSELLWLILAATCISAIMVALFTPGSFWRRLSHGVVTALLVSFAFLFTLLTWIVAKPVLHATNSGIDVIWILTTVLAWLPGLAAAMLAGAFTGKPNRQIRLIALLVLAVPLLMLMHTPQIFGPIADTILRHSGIQQPNSQWLQVKLNSGERLNEHTLKAFRHNQLLPTTEVAAETSATCPPSPPTQTTAEGSAQWLCGYVNYEFADTKVFCSAALRISQTNDASPLKKRVWCLALNKGQLDRAWQISMHAPSELAAPGSETKKQ